MNTPTPRTDAAIIRDKMILSEVGLLEIVDAGPCRQLERDLAAAQAELAQERERADAAVKELGWRRKQDVERQAEFFAERERAEKNARDAERIDWMERAMFDKWWNGVIDSGSRTYWRICGPYRHVTAKMVGHTFRAALDAAIAGEKK